MMQQYLPGTPGVKGERSDLFHIWISLTNVLITAGYTDRLFLTLNVISQNRPSSPFAFDRGQTCPAPRSADVSLVGSKRQIKMPPKGLG